MIALEISLTIKDVQAYNVVVSTGTTHVKTMLANRLQLRTHGIAAVHRLVMRTTDPMVPILAHEIL